jgi:hypothetical protein
MAENRCPGCGAEGMTSEERKAGMCYDCQRMQRKISETLGSRMAVLPARPTFGTGDPRATGLKPDVRRTTWPRS